MLSVSAALIILTFGLLIVPLLEVKSYAVVLSFYIKIVKERTLQLFSLKHSIKKGTFFLFRAKWKLFKSDRGEYSPPPPFLEVTVINMNISIN